MIIIMLDLLPLEDFALFHLIIPPSGGQQLSSILTYIFGVSISDTSKKCQIIIIPHLVVLDQSHIESKSGSTLKLISLYTYSVYGKNLL